MKLFAIIPGFGMPEIDQKERILRGNLGVLRAAWPALHVRVCCYEAGYAFPQDIASQIESVHEPGIIGQFLLKYAHPEEVAAHGATHVAILMDDVELLPGVDFRVMLGVLKKMAGHVVSPVLTSDRPSPWPFMNHRPHEAPGTAIRAGACELFFMVMPLPGYARYFSGLDWRNPWCWGVDLSMQARGLSSILFNDMQVRHWFTGGSDSGTSRSDEAAYFARRGWTKEATVQSLRFEQFTYRVNPPATG